MYSMKQPNGQLKRRASATFMLALATLATLALPVGAQNFGTAVAVSGEQILIGDGANPGFPGKVYFFGIDESAQDGTQWRELGRITVSDQVDRFGTSIAATESLLVVGAPGSKSVYVFERSEDGVGWVQSAAISGEGDTFGSAVSTDGVHLIVASRATDKLPGSAAVYRKVGKDWQLETTLLSEDPDNSLLSSDAFGQAVAIRNGVAFVSAPAASENAGAVYAYTLDPVTGQWSTGSTLNTRLESAGNRFGASLSFVDSEATRIAVGMPGFANRTGMVVVFSRADEPNAWTVDEQLSPFSSVRAEGFGSAVAVAGNELWVGAPGYGGRFGTGAVYTFSLTADMPEDVATAVAGLLGRGGTDDQTIGLGRTTASSILPVKDLQERSQLGASLATNGRVAVIGTPGFDNRAGAGIGFIRAADDHTEAPGYAWKQSEPLINEIESYASMTGGMIECKEDVAGDFPCKGVDMSAFLSLKDLGADRGIRLNDLWGWDDETTGREYAIVGLSNQASFVDVTDAFNPIYLGKLPMPKSANMSVWRDMKVYRDHVYIVADGAGDHGMQVFDLRQLRGIETPQVFEPTAHYRGIHSAHNIVINEDTGFAYSVGSSSGGETCGGGLHMIDIREPANPVFVGCFSDGTTGRRGTGYSHDAQCVIYAGPDRDYVDHEVCFGSNETALSIADVTDKENPTSISIATYPKAQYTHQGWLTDDHRYFYLNDELDESGGLVDGTRTMIFDLSDLDDPLLVGEHISETTETDHNLYVKGNLMYQSNTGAGLRILDISDPEHPVETAFFDTSPVGGRGGTWSNYPYFKSGKIAVTGGHYGLFILRKTDIGF